MPYFWTNKITIKASDKETMDKFLKAGKVHKEENRIDGCKYSFESWRPMPRTFRQYDTTNFPNGEHLEIGQPLGFAQDAPLVTKEIVKNFKKATVYQKKKYGVIGWYDFGLKYWGTKWNAGFDITRVSDTAVKLSDFKTAWSTPLEFLEYITKKYHIVIELNAHYEDGGDIHYIIRDSDTESEYEYESGD